jgi:hypothetical protein
MLFDTYRLPKGRRRLAVTLMASVCFGCMMSCTREVHPLPKDVGAVSGNRNPDVSHRNALQGPAKTNTTHLAERRKRSLVDLLIEVEHGRTLNEKDVALRMGKPDWTQQTYSKQYTDRIILTLYRYDLAPGEYVFPNSERVALDSGGQADCIFDDREQVHDPRGRLFSTVDNMAPLSVVSVTDSHGTHVIFPTNMRPVYGDTKGRSIEKGLPATANVPTDHPNPSPSPPSPASPSK